MNPTKKSLLCIALITTLTACSGSNENAPTVTPVSEKSAGIFSLATDDTAFEEAIKNALLPKPTENSFAIAQASPGELAADSSSSRFTSTYVLENGVDEADMVKYTGDYLLVARNSNSYQCCPACSCAIPFEGNNNNDSQIQIFSADTDAATTMSIAAFTINDIVVPELDAEQVLTNTAQITGIYTEGDQNLLVLGSSSPAPLFGDAWFSSTYWMNNISYINIYDLSNPSEVALNWGASINGNLVQSRRIGNVLYLVTRYTPYIEGMTYYHSNDPAVTAQQNSLINNAELEDLVPLIRISNGSDAEVKQLFNPTDCYIPTDSTAESSADGSITSITAIPINNPDDLSTTCYTGNAHGMYMSDKALYLAEQNYAQDIDEKDSTIIHKFAVNSTSTSYSGSGEVDGTLGGRGALDFRLSEYNNNLRVVTSVFDFSDQGSDTADIVDHQLTILAESDTEYALTTVATLPNTDRPQEIGKPNETLYAVRFSGDRAYLVTFERIDPLYVLDLSDPQDPIIAGELEVPGFSDFIHPVSDNLILALGKDVTPTDQGFAWFGGLKVDLYNVSDISNPVSLSSMSIGDRGTDSEALYDRHAFTYRQMSDDQHRFAIPIDLFEQDPELPNEPGNRTTWTGSGLHLFEIDMIQTPDAAMINHKGEMRTENNSGDGYQYPSYDYHRSIFHDEAVIYVDSQGVWSAIWTDPETLQGPVNPAP